jgi:PAS domain S-box-containing protein
MWRGWRALRGAREALAESERERELLLEERQSALVSSHQSEAALQASEASFRALIEASPDAVAVYRDGALLYTNPTMLRLLGYPDHASLAGMEVADFVHPQDRARADADVNEMLRTGKPTPLRELRFMTRGGDVITAEVTSLTVQFQGRPAVATLGRDTRERRQMTARMMQVDRMTAIATLVAGLGHELNNPLSYVMANLDFATEYAQGLQERGEESAAELLEVLSDARGGARRVREVIRSLRTFARADARSFGEVDLEPVLRRALEVADHELSARAAVSLEVEGPLVVRGNEARLGQMLLNLLLNAAQAMSRPSPGEAVSRSVQVRGWREGKRVWLEVRDSGPGLSEEALRRVFDPFFTTRPTGEGTGLGLYICREIVRSHGGEITLENHPEGGAIARVSLPAQPTGDAAGKPRVLVLDDDPRVATAVGRTLEVRYQVEISSDPEGVLARLEAGERFDAIVCDLAMPDVSGMDVFERLEALDPEAAGRMIFLTGGTFSSRATRFAQRMADRCMEKPARSSEIQALLEQMLGRPPA